MANVVHDKLDVRPDRVDLRDREYQPALKSLPAVYPAPVAIAHYMPRYSELILDQQGEGACTGFGLAAVVNYLYWSRSWRERLLLASPESSDDFPEPDSVAGASPRMLYHLARLYDEWPGEDYVGSSCRGAMKGWHRHGVCSDDLWPYVNSRGNAMFVPPGDGWQDDAALRPLGAYYRIKKESVSDIHAALYEVGAVYCSAAVHSGWNLTDWDANRKPAREVWAPASQPNLKMPIIQPPPPAEFKSGHAFALVGYNEHGFIVQNSWGDSWGYHGFAVLPYSDWAENGMDAWVSVLGAPVKDRPDQGVVQSANSNSV
nr:C1 family peptidase [Planctomycetota bacterium]